MRLYKPLNFSEYFSRAGKDPVSKDREVTLNQHSKHLFRPRNTVILFPLSSPDSFTAPDVWFFFFCNANFVYSIFGATNYEALNSIYNFNYFSEVMHANNLF